MEVVADARPGGAPGCGAFPSGDGIMGAPVSGFLTSRRRLTLSCVVSAVSENAMDTFVKFGTVKSEEKNMSRTGVPFKRVQNPATLARENKFRGPDLEFDFFQSA